MIRQDDRPEDPQWTVFAHPGTARCHRYTVRTWRCTSGSTKHTKHTGDQVSSDSNSPGSQPAPLCCSIIGSFHRAYPEMIEAIKEFNDHGIDVRSPIVSTPLDLRSAFVR